MQILNAAVESYNSTTAILAKAKTGAFLDKWIAVSRDLYDKGVTDYVLECFGLEVNKLSEAVKSKPGKSSLPMSIDNAPKPSSQEPKTAPIADIAGLIEETAQTQGWCAEVFEANKRAVVEISVSTSSYGASGTGFIISRYGYLLTNDHVVFDERSSAYYTNVKMSLAGDKKKYKIEVMFSDKKYDVALCKFAPEEVIGGFSVVRRITDYSKLKQGADCLVIGNAFGMGLAPFTGIIRFTKSNSGNLVYTAPSNPGDSGGPVFDRNGQCIGINKAKTVAVNGTTADSYANATPMDQIDSLLQKWTNNNDIKL